MIKINIWDTNIAHANSWKEAGLMCGIRIPDSDLITGPKDTMWIRNQKSHDGITVFTDSHFNRNTINSVISPIKIGLIMEPIAHSYQPYSDIQDVEDLLDFIFTFNKQLIDKDPDKYKFIPADWCCIEAASHGGNEKSKLVSMLNSTKVGIDRPLRHRVVERYSNKIDTFGGGTQVDLKSDTLNSYMFSIAMENSIDDFYYTEKIIDCFITKNVPIYRGAKNIGDFFDARGIIQWTNISELQDILEGISPERYQEMLPYINKNYYIAKGYINPDDVLLRLIQSCNNDNKFNTIKDFRYDKNYKI